MIYHVQFPGLGLEFAVNRVALSIGSFNVYWYGIMLALGMVAGLVFLFHYAQDFGIDSDRAVDVVTIGTVMAIVCARTYYVALSPYEYNSIWEVIDLRQGGIAVYGSIFGAFVFGGLACKWRKIPMLPMYDAVAIGFLAGQGIGRWGNFFNQEAFGYNTTLPWGMISEETTAYLSTAPITVPDGITIDPNLPVHPTFLYESLWCLLGFALFVLLFKKRKFNGEVFLLYVIWYGVERFVVEGLRTDSLMVFANLRMSQIVAVVSVAVALVLEVIFRRRYAGKILTMPLSISTENLKWMKKNGITDFTPDTLPAAASHAEFVKATDEMNKNLQATVLNPQNEQMEDAAEENPTQEQTETAQKNEYEIMEESQKEKTEENNEKAGNEVGKTETLTVTQEQIQSETAPKTETGEDAEEKTEKDPANTPQEAVQKTETGEELSQIETEKEEYEKKKAELLNEMQKISFKREGE